MPWQLEQFSTNKVRPAASWAALLRLSWLVRLAAATVLDLAESRHAASEHEHAEEAGRDNERHGSKGRAAKIAWAVTRAGTGR